MLILSIDTISEAPSIEVRSDGKILCSEILPSRHNQSEELLSEIEKILHKCQVKKEELDLITVSNEPGSYTGARVGITTANFMAFGLNIPVVAADSCNKQQSEGANFSGPVLPKYKSEPFITKKKLD